MNIRRDIWLSKELYDRVMELAKTSDGLQNFVEGGTRFWLQVAEASGDPLPQLTAEQDALARRLLHFLFATDDNERQAVLLLMDNWYHRDRDKQR